MELVESIKLRKWSCSGAEASPVNAGSDTDLGVVDLEIRNAWKLLCKFPDRCGLTKKMTGPLQVRMLGQEG